MPYVSSQGTPNFGLPKLDAMKKQDLSKQPHLARRLQEVLDEKEHEGVTQAGIAKACGIKPPSVNAWLTQETKSISAAHAVRAAQYLGVTVAWLVLEQEPKFPEVDAEDYRVALALHSLDKKVRDSFVKGIFAALDEKPDDKPPRKGPRLNT